MARTGTNPPKTSPGEAVVVGATRGALTDDCVPDGCVERIELSGQRKAQRPPLPRRLSPVGAIVVRQSVNDGYLSIAVASENERVIGHS